MSFTQVNRTSSAPPRATGIDDGRPTLPRSASEPSPATIAKESRLSSGLSPRKLWTAFKNQVRSPRGSESPAGRGPEAETLEQSAPVAAPSTTFDPDRLPFSTGTLYESKDAQERFSGSREQFSEEPSLRRGSAALDQHPPSGRKGEGASSHEVSVSADLPMSFSPEPINSDFMAKLEEAVREMGGHSSPEPIHSDFMASIGEAVRGMDGHPPNTDAQSAAPLTTVRPIDHPEVGEAAMDQAASTSARDEERILSPKPRRPASVQSLEDTVEPLSLQSFAERMSPSSEPFPPPEDGPAIRRAPTPSSGQASPAPPSILSDASSGATSATLSEPFKPAFSVPEQEPRTATPARPVVQGLAEGASSPTLPSVPPEAGHVLLDDEKANSIRNWISQTGSSPIDDEATPASGLARPPASPPSLPEANAATPAQPQTATSSRPQGRPLTSSQLSQSLARPASVRSLSQLFVSSTSVEALREARTAWGGLKQAVKDFPAAFASSPLSALRGIRESARHTYRSTRGFLDADLLPRDVKADVKASLQDLAGRSTERLLEHFMGYIGEFSQAVGEFHGAGRPVQADQEHKVARAYHRADGTGRLIEERGIDAQLREKQTAFANLFESDSRVDGAEAEVQALADQLLNEIANLERRKEDLRSESAPFGVAA